MINVTFWLLGFLRMATTGLSAQAYGASDRDAQAVVFIQGMALAWLMALVLIIFHKPVADLIFHFSAASSEVKTYAEQYFSIRIWGAPAALANFVIMGWLLGTQNAKLPMWLLIVTNIVNIGLDVLFVLGFGWKVQGVAAASVLAEYSGLILGLWFVSRQWRSHALPALRAKLGSARQGMGRLLRLNRDIFLRSFMPAVNFHFHDIPGRDTG